MLDILQFIFADFWHFIGITILLLIFVDAIKDIIVAIIQRNKTLDVIVKEVLKQLDEEKEVEENK